MQPQFPPAQGYGSSVEGHCRVVSNIEEVRARKGPIIGVGTEGCTKLERVCDDVMWIPECPDYLTPLLTVIPLQLFAYHTAVHLGCDVDKPRNLAKSVTVE
jgi:glucosamine--fructose-6-phosphate aminotransferase (isomerizing)